MKIHFLDSSVFCNILEIPGRSEHIEETRTELKRIIANSSREHIILPFATIIETGNHISHIGDGRLRRSSAEKYCEIMEKTINGKAPWTYYGAQMTEDDIKSICSEFPNSVTQGKGIGDLSIIRAYEKYKDETPAIEEIRIWSYDRHLSVYHQENHEVIGILKRGRR